MRLIIPALIAMLATPALADKGDRTRLAVNVTNYSGNRITTIYSVPRDNPQGAQTVTRREARQLVRDGAIDTTGIVRVRDKRDRRHRRR